MSSFYYCTYYVRADLAMLHNIYREGNIFIRNGDSSIAANYSKATHMLLPRNSTLILYLNVHPYSFNTRAIPNKTRIDSNTNCKTTGIHPTSHRNKINGTGKGGHPFRSKPEYKALDYRTNYSTTAFHISESTPSIYFPT
jgi:hypothetical protein